MKNIDFILTNPASVLPSRSHDSDSGLDFYSPYDFILEPGESIKVDLGLKVILPKLMIPFLSNFFTIDMFIQPRSSLNAAGIFLGGGVIDNGYRGNIIVNLWNLGDSTIKIKEGDRICQGVCRIVWVPIPNIPESDYDVNTSRGKGSFGSTGS